MKAVVVRQFGAIGDAAVEDIETPEPGAGEVLIEIGAVAANFVDGLVIEGRYQFLPDPPFIPGKLPVGTVRRIGPGVDGLEIGMRVLTMAEQGGYAQAVCVDQHQCVRLPDALGFEEAASISLAFDTAWVALTDRARLAEGETVLVLGATGAVGLAAIQLAKARGARVLAAVASPDRAAAVRRSGADAIVDLSVSNLHDGLREQVYAETGGKGADVVIDPLGGDYFAAAIRAVAWRGRLVVVGFASGTIPILKANYLLLKNIEVSGIQVSDYRKRMPDMMQYCFNDIFNLYDQGEIQHLPYKKYELGEFAQALEDIRTRRIRERVILCPHA